MPKKLKDIPIFKSEDKEREFWANEDSTDFIDWEQGEVQVLPNLKPATRTISLRISESMLNQIRLIANQRDVPYQSLIKMFLKTGLRKN
ncbi:MAG: BrnA antitoxin family protein [Acidobacteria bacterium]|nr:BrnA antitoxin family protein [Acidobacteriota bacterium]